MNDLMVAAEPGDRIDSMSMREKVNAIEVEMRKLDTIELPVNHYFSQGVYARELFIPKGTLATGKIHKYIQLNIMPMGDVSLLTDDGIRRIKAPYTVVSPAGTKRIVYAHEDTIWITIHGTDETDLEKIETHYIAQNETEYLEFCGQLSLTELDTKCLGSR